MMKNKTIQIEVHDNDRRACKNIEHFESNFKDDMFKANGYAIKVVYKRNSNKSCYTVITQNGDTRDVERLRLDLLMDLLLNLTGIKIN